MSTIERAIAVVEDIQPIIDHVADTEIDAWQCDVVRSADGTRNCFFGHLFQWAEDTAIRFAPGVDPETWANRVWEAFEERWVTTYVIYPVNDGTNPCYVQDTARDRIVAFLGALRDGRKMTTIESMDAEYERYCVAG